MTSNFTYRQHKGPVWSILDRRNMTLYTRFSASCIGNALSSRAILSLAVCTRSLLCPQKWNCPWNNIKNNNRQFFFSNCAWVKGARVPRRCVYMPEGGSWDTLSPGISQRCRSYHDDCVFLCEWWRKKNFTWAAVRNIGNHTAPELGRRDCLTSLYFGAEHMIPLLCIVMWQGFDVSITCCFNDTGEHHSPLVVGSVGACMVGVKGWTSSDRSDVAISSGHGPNNSNLELDRRMTVLDFGSSL